MVLKSRRAKKLIGAATIVQKVNTKQWFGVKNDIRISLLAAETGEAPKKFYVEIEIGKKKSRDPSKYLAEDARKQVYKYYIYYYEKHRNAVS